MSALAHNEVESECENDETSVGIFWEPSTLGDILLVAHTVTKLGYVPELRIVSDGTAIEVYTKDLPAMVRNLRASIEGGGKRRRTSDNDARWGSVTDDTPVLFDGEPCRFGSLSQNDKMMCEFNASGQLTGGHPF